MPPARARRLAHGLHRGPVPSRTPPGHARRVPDPMQLPPDTWRTPTAGNYDARLTRFLTRRFTPSRPDQASARPITRKSDTRGSRRRLRPGAEEGPGEDQAIRRSPPRCEAHRGGRPGPGAETASLHGIRSPARTGQPAQRGGHDTVTATDRLSCRTTWRSPQPRSARRTPTSSSSIAKERPDGLITNTASNGRLERRTRTIYEDQPGRIARRPSRGARRRHTVAAPMAATAQKTGR